MKQGKVRNAADILWNQGPAAFFQRLRFRLKAESQKRAYQRFVQAENELKDTERQRLRTELEQFASKPLISIILPVFDVDAIWLRKCIDSVVDQVYDNWELCIADDCSPSPHVRSVLEEYRDGDDRIKVVFRNANGHISAASNSALELANGEFTVLLDHDDELSVDALFYVANEINQHPDVMMIYSDQDLVDKKGRRYSPSFKPDWSRDLFYSTNLITHLSAYRTSLLKKIGGFTIGLEGSQDYDLALRVIEQINEDQIRHIPRILYHWRVIETSVAADSNAKPYAHQAARDAIAAHLKRTGKRAKVTQTIYNLHRVRYLLPGQPGVASVIMQANENPAFIEQSLKTFDETTDYPDLEFVVVCAAGQGKTLETRLAGIKNVKIVETGKSNEAEQLNLAAAKASGEVICFVDANLKPLANDWLEELVSFAVQDEIGAVGAKVLYRNGTILHGGLLVGVGGTVGIAHHGWPSEADGNISRTRLIGNFSAVSVSCMAVKKSLFDEVGGFDDRDYPNWLFDADFCLRLGEKNLRTVWTPYARLRVVDKHMQLRPETEIDQSEASKFQTKWARVIAQDPFYNPNLSKDTGDFFLVSQAM